MEGWAIVAILPEPNQNSEERPVSLNKEMDKDKTMVVQSLQNHPFICICINFVLFSRIFVSA